MKLLVWFGAREIGPRRSPARSSTTVTFVRLVFPTFRTVPLTVIGWLGPEAFWQALVTSIAGVHVTAQIEEAVSLTGPRLQIETGCPLAVTTLEEGLVVGT